MSSAAALTGSGGSGGGGGAGGGGRKKPTNPPALCRPPKRDKKRFKEIIVKWEGGEQLTRAELQFFIQYWRVWVMNSAAYGHFLESVKESLEDIEGILDLAQE